MNLFAKQRCFNWKQCSSRLLLCLSGFLFLSSTPSWANEASEQAIAEAPIEVPQDEGIDVEDETDPANALLWTPILLSEVEQPTTTVADWIAQIEASEVHITEVRLDSTEAGLSIVLETPEGELSAPRTQTVGNAVIAEIPNAVLDLPEGEPFEQFDPAEGITLVSVTDLPDGGVRVSITGTNTPPQAQVGTEAGNLVLRVVSGVATANELDEEAIQIVVTATRTEEEIQDIPRSVTVITREELEQQTNLTTNLIDILGQTVPGLGPPTQSFSPFSQTLRGRGAQVLIDGVPVNSNQESGQDEFRNVTPSAIERIEVVRGPSAAYGEGATGGVINIITRRPTEDEITSTLETRVNSVGDLAAESFGTYLEYGLSGTVDPFDFVVNLSWERFGFAFDGAGDQIPGSNVRLENGRTLNAFGKFGIDIGDNQRFQLSVNRYDDESELEFISDPTVDDDPDADKARVLERDIEFIDLAGDGDSRRAITVNLNYSHDNIFGSQLRLQGFYRDGFSFFAEPFEDTFEGVEVFVNTRFDTERFGGRLEVETPFSETFNLLWGADYSKEDLSQINQLIDADEFVNSGFRVARFLGEEVFFTPPYTVENLGVFAQTQWDITPSWLLSGGVRYENIGLSADDYTLRLFFDPPLNVEGGNLTADDVVFNIGTVYDLTEELNVFASFSQGFGVPDFGRLLRNPPDGLRSLEDDLDFTAPQKVNNYELGFSGQWDDVQFSLAGFYNDSELGVTLIPTASGQVTVARAPERVYGIEATVDWQPSDAWQLGSIISWSEGENDLDEDGDFEAFGSSRIQPIKITFYVENETLPGWRNRFQSLYVGDRSRGFESGADAVDIDGYFVLDYISSIDLGPGTVQIGIQNLLDEEYFPIASQISAPFSPIFNVAAPGRTISIGYRVTF